MKITWIGHSCFKIEDQGSSVVLDPYGDGSVPGLLPVREKAGMVLCSHGHGDHNAAGNVEIMNEPGAAFKITKIDTYHDDKKGKLRGNNIIHILEKGPWKIVHFGDIGCQLTPEQAELLKGADAVMIPVGGYYTVNAEEAAQIVREISPKMIIPMHFRGEGFGFDVISTVEHFEALFPKAETGGASEICLDENIPEAAGSAAVLRPKNLA